MRAASSPLTRSVASSRAWQATKITRLSCSAVGETGRQTQRLDWSFIDLM